MKKLLLFALALFATPGLAQVSPTTPARAPGGFLPAGANFCSADGGTTWTPCTGGGGGAGGGDASAANQTSVQALPGSDSTKANAVQGVTGGKPISVTGTFYQATQPVSAAALPLPSGAATAAKQDSLLTALGTPLQAGGTVNLGTGGLGSSGSPIYTQSATATSGATGSAVPANAVSHGGRDPSGNMRQIAVDTGGRLLPGQGQVTSTRTTLTASTATALEAAGVTTRILESVTTEAALTANVFLCSSQTTSCSATSYDFMLPSGAGAGTTFTPPFATQGRLYAYSTGTPVLVLNSWTAQ